MDRSVTFHDWPLDGLSAPLSVGLRRALQTEPPALKEMPMPEPVIAFIGGGPRTAGLLERLARNREELFGGRFSVCVVEPWEPGSGRIWRCAQHPLLRLNSMAVDVTLFTDDSVACEGPAADGPSLIQWARGVANGSITDARIRSAEVMQQIRALEPASFPTRQLQSHYLEWFFRRSAALLEDSGVPVEIVRDTVTATENDGGRHLLRLAGGGSVAADLVVYSLGHTDTEPSAAAGALAGFARRHGCFYAGPAYTTDVDYSEVKPGSEVIVSGMGLAFVDLMVLLMEGRGGTFADAADGTLEYRPCGLEPRLWVGSRRGVPYHSKISSTMKAAPEANLRFFTAAAVGQLALEHGTLDFRTHIWPLLAKEAGYGYYRELFLGYPQRVTLGWEEFAAAYAGTKWYSAARTALVAAAVPDPALRLDLENLDQPLAGTHLPDLTVIQETVAAYINQDLALRTAPDHSETLGLFMALLRVYMEAGRILPPDLLTAESRLAISGWWHGFFSFVDSGPPPERLRELLALHRAGLVLFLGPDLEVTTDEETGLFTARSAGCRQSVSAAAFIEARLPEPSVRSSANPALRSLHAAGIGFEEVLPAGGGMLVTGKLTVDRQHRVLDSSGKPAPGLFAVGAATSAWGAGAFSRPHSNASVFGVNDALARLLLAEAGVPVRSPEVSGEAPVGASPEVSLSSSAARFGASTILG